MAPPSDHETKVRVPCGDRVFSVCVDPTIVVFVSGPGPCVPSYRTCSPVGEVVTVIWTV